ncbi:MAG: hypothetical protein AAGF53_03430 [Pseudomonadota bacterium]
MAVAQAGVRGYLNAVLFDLLGQLRWSFLPPLMVYFAAGCSGLTLIVGTFFVKEYLDFSAAYIAGLAFWAGLPWALKMPLGHLVDLIWRWKWLLVWLGAGCVAASVGIMYMVLTFTTYMQMIMPVPSWYIISFLLAPCGLVLQDVVADAMSIEAVPTHGSQGRPLPEAEIKNAHVTMQTLGRFALIGGTVAVALLNIAMFSGIEELDQAGKGKVYANVYMIAFLIPVISISGVVLAGLQRRMTGANAAAIEPAEAIEPNWWYFIGGGAFVVLSLIVGLGEVPFGQEIIFAGSMAIVLLLMRQLIAALEPTQAKALIGTAVIIFFFRATPLPGDGQTWFQIDVLGFDQQFLSLLSLITSVVTLAVIVLLRPMMANHSIVWIVVVLSILAGLLSLPNIGLYYGLHNWTSDMTGGFVDARFIAIFDTALESPLGQVAMIPMLAWIAKNAPRELKATFFAVMASFTNLAISASTLGTKYLNQVYLVTREVKDPESGAITTAANYSELGWLLITVSTLIVVLPLLVVFFVQRTALRSTD